MHTVKPLTYAHCAAAPAPADATAATAPATATTGQIISSPNTLKNMKTKDTVLRAKVSIYVHT
jgi:hypothetical protein